ncbi:hypothetical protein [Janibacter sp. GS2]|uniref:hypothetical protein n=1 Tax=Janibacter sp. GS2 TaxID=3442646 RepID=UPI003EBE51E7
MSTTSAPAPTPAEVLAGIDHRAKYNSEVDLTIAACSERLRRGVSPQEVTDELRKRYLWLARIAAAAEVLDDVALEQKEVQFSAGAVERARNSAAAHSAPPRQRVGDGVVRYSPFGSAQPRASRKAARA